MSLFNVQRAMARDRKRLFAAGSTATLTCALAVFAASGALAQSTDGSATGAADASANGSVLSEVVVTAQFQEQNLQNTPIAITALNAAMLEARGITDVTQVSQAAPNVNLNVAGSGYGRATQAFIRGIGQTDVLFSFEPRVGFYIDDVYYSTVFGSVFDLTDIERVEVLRGPQGTLFGRNSAGGAVRIFSKQPRGDGSGYIEATGGSYNRRDLKAAFDVSLVPDKLFLRVAGGVLKRDGYVDLVNFRCANPTLGGSLPLVNGHGRRNGCQVGTLGGTDVSNVRASLRWIVSPTIEDTLSADYMNDDSEPTPDTLIALSGADPNTGAANGLARWNATIGGPQYGITLNDNFIAPDRYTSYAIFGNPGNGRPQAVQDNPPVNTVRSWGVSNTLKWDVTDGVNLTSITAYRQFTGEFGSNLDADAAPTQQLYTEMAHHQLSQELRLSGQALGGRLDWTLGGFYFDAANDMHARIDIEAFPAGPFDFYADDPSSLKNQAVFAHGVAHLTDKLTLTAGVRYSHESKDYTFQRSYIAFPFVPVFVPPAALNFTTDTSQKIHKINPKVALDYQWTPNFMTYVDYSTGFTSGGFNSRPSSAAEVFPFGPETVTSYEAGFKSQFLDNRVRLNGAAFYSDYKDLQLSVRGSPPVTPVVFVTNAGDAHIKGGELELSARPTPDWLLDASAGYTHFRYSRLDPGVLAFLNYDSQPPHTPKWKFSAGTQYRIGLGGTGSLTPRADLVYQSKTYYGPNINEASTNQDGYTLVNARVTWQPTDLDWSVALSASNLFDKFYYVSKADGRNSTGALIGTVGAPRELAVTVRRVFD